MKSMKLFFFRSFVFFTVSFVFIRVHPMNRSHSSPKFPFFFFHCIFHTYSLWGRRPLHLNQGSRTPKTGRSQVEDPASYSCSSQTDGTSNFIRPKGPILRDMIFAEANSYEHDQDPFICPVILIKSLKRLSIHQKPASH